MIPEHFHTTIANIDERICKEIVDPTDDTAPLLDGIINPDLYFNRSLTKYRILWILKEPYDDFDKSENPVGGGWNYRAAMNDNPIRFSKISTWQRIAYASYGILNSFCQYDDMDFIDKNPVIFEAVKHIAFINVKKLPGGKNSSEASIKNAYANHKSILLQQIETYQPDIIIGGNTLPYFIKDLNLDSGILYENNDPKYYLKDSRLYLLSYHPSYYKNDEDVEDYINDIINVVKNNQSKLITTR